MKNFYCKVYNDSDIGVLVEKYNLQDIITYKHLPAIFTINGTGEEFISIIRNLHDDPAVISLQPDHLNISTCEIGEPTVVSRDETLSVGGGRYVWDLVWQLEYSLRRKKLVPDINTTVYAPTYTGNGVDVYIIDTGILFSHVQLGNTQALPGYIDPFGNNGIDGAGHGTHVAGAIGGSVTGIAPDCTMFGMRMFNNAGAACTAAEFTGGINAIITHHKSRNKPAVANLSLGSYPRIDYPYVFEEDPSLYDDYLDDGVKALKAAGITVCVAAGNGFAISTDAYAPWLGMDSAMSRPGRVPGIITVGAINSLSNKCSFSNYGRGVDIYAPGQDIVSSYIDYPDSPNNTYVYLSGTSMACPVVAGICVLLLEQHPTYTPDQIAELLISYSSESEITNLNTANTLDNDGVLKSGISLLSFNPITSVITPLDYHPGVTKPNKIAVIKSVNGTFLPADGTCKFNI